MNSIRMRIIVFLVIGLGVLNVIAGVFIYDYSREEIEELFAAEQAQLARTIDGLISSTSIPDSTEAIVSSVPDIQEDQPSQYYGHEYEAKIAYQVWDLHGNLLLMSENAPLYPLSATAPGFSEIKYDNIRWHIFALYSNSAQKWIYTAQQDAVRQELIGLIASDNLSTMAVVNILVLVIVIIGVFFGTKPLTEFSRELAERHANNLKPITLDVKQELFPIKSAINALLERIQKVLVHEKNFNADLAHELRTPLAAIKVHVQSIELKERLSDTSGQAVRKIIKSIDNMSHMIEQLLLLNRLESEFQKIVAEDIHLFDLAKEAITLLPSTVLAKYEFELKGDDVVAVGNRALLQTLLRNLIENAHKYSQPNSLITVEVSKIGKSPVISIEDNGPGMTDEQKSNSIKRMYRVSDTQTYGSGIGLSIVMKIVDLHGAKLEFLDKESEPGLIARVSFPASHHKSV